MMKSNLSFSHLYNSAEMRSTALCCTLTAVLSTTIAATLPPLQQQPQLPFLDSMTPSTSSSPSLTDLLTRSKSSIFYGYIRESTYISTRLANPLESTTILAPLNSAILSLARKPHQGRPEPVEGHVEGYAGSREDEQDRADYLENWIKRHLIDGKVELEGEGKDYETLHDGEKVSFVKGDGDALYKVMPGDVEVVEIEQVDSPSPTFSSWSLAESLSNILAGVEWSHPVPSRHSQYRLSVMYQRLVSEFLVVFFFSSVTEH